MQTGINLNKATWPGFLVTLGIIFGDIGTSPLYVMKAIVGDKPISEILVLGGIVLRLLDDHPTDNLQVCNSCLKCR